MLGLPVAAIVGPAYWMDCGTEQPMIELASVEHVHACRPVAALMARFSRNTAGQPKTYVFARTAEGFESRYFWMSGESSISEDPGTGSACANLGAWWLLTEGDRPLHATVRQATSSGRQSVLTLDVEQGKVEVGGRVIVLGKGELIW